MRREIFVRALKAFSLLELLLVLTLIAGLSAASVAAYFSMTQAAALGTGAETLNDLLGDARQDAVTQNTPVEVRLYDLADPTPDYRAVQLHWLKADGTKPAAGNLLFLPTGVVIDSTAMHSSIIGSNPLTATPDPADSHFNSQTRVFHFFPDGSTDLPAGSSWFLTLRAATQSDPAHFPSNWASITVDPATGRAQIFRP